MLKKKYQTSTTYESKTAVLFRIVGMALTPSLLLGVNVQTKCWTIFFSADIWFGIQEESMQSEKKYKQKLFKQLRKFVTPLWINRKCKMEIRIWNTQTHTHTTNTTCLYARKEWRKSTKMLLCIVHIFAICKHYWHLQTIQIWNHSLTSAETLSRLDIVRASVEIRWTLHFISHAFDTR